MIILYPRQKSVNGIANKVRALRQAALLHYVQDLMLRDKDLEPIFDLERMPFTGKNVSPLNIPGQIFFDI